MKITKTEPSSNWRKLYPECNWLALEEINSKTIQDIWEGKSNKLVQVEEILVEILKRVEVLENRESSPIV